jgi:glutamine amidotransferase
MTVAIVDYGSGNLRSAAKAIERAARESGADDRVLVTSNPREVADADRIVLPGVGAFADCRAGLYGVPGMVDVLQREVVERGKPFLGICVGMQLMAEVGEEMGEHAGLGWIKGRVRLLTPADPAAKVPHMGWNDVRPTAPHPLIEAGEAYFLHSYAFEGADVVATTDHGRPVVAAIARDNMAGVQFHPEKSQRYGLELLKRFLTWRP